MTSEGKAALIDMAIEVGSMLIRRILSAINDGDNEPDWVMIDSILPVEFKTKLTLIKADEKARKAIQDALTNP